MFRRLLTVAVLLVTVPIALATAGLLVLWLWAHFVTSPRFASEYFAGLTTVERIEASRRYHWGAHPWGGNGFGCSWAIAMLPGEAPEQPPARESHRGFPYNWPKDWSPTPVVTRDGNHAILDECTYALEDDLASRLSSVHNTEGAFYSVGSETLFLYAPDDRLIARIRFGD